jgi:hypothetical protein
MQRTFEAAFLLRHTAGQLYDLRHSKFRGRRGARFAALCAGAGRELRRMALRDTRTVVISHPKSGRTWLRFMLDDIGIHLRYDHFLGAKSVPATLQGKKLLFVHRDPRDTLLSYWFALTKRRPTLSAPLAELLRDRSHGLARIIDYNLFWNDAVRRSGGCVTSYEALHRDTEEELARIVAFITSKPVSPATLRAAVAAGTFERMRALEASGRGAALYGGPLDPSNPADTDSYKTRRGIVGGWRDAFSVSDREYADGLLEASDYFAALGVVGPAAN